MSSDEYFRAGVGIMVIDSRGLVLGLERSDLSGAWQVPQGGITHGEEPLEAAKRELFEEIGVGWQDIDLLDVHPSWLAYELPPSSRSHKTGRGQVLRWFLGRFVGRDGGIQLEPTSGEREFSQWQWMRIANLIALAWEIRRPIYRELALYWSDKLT